MVMVGFNFTKIAAERSGANAHNVHVQNNISLTDVNESTIADPKKALVKFNFEFICNYTPAVGSIVLKGELVEMYDKEVATKIVSGWNDAKKVPAELMEKVLNTVLAKANVEALIISRELGLPSPIAMPKVTVSKKDGAAPTKTEAPAKDAKKKK